MTYQCRRLVLLSIIAFLLLNDKVVYFVNLQLRKSTVEHTIL